MDDLADRARALDAAAPRGGPELGALCPLDGRYSQIAALLRPYFSEFALIRYRLKVEVEWLIAIANEPAFAEAAPMSADQAERLRRWVENLGEAEAARVKNLEATTRHDVKAVEYHLRSRLADLGLSGLEPFVHFCCTSEDINNVSYALMLRDGIAQAWRPEAEGLIGQLLRIVDEGAAIAMMARTHGQPASPTTLGKEIGVFAHRLARQLEQIGRVEYLAKFSGAVGNYNAHVAAYPGIDWVAFTRRFLEGFGLTQNPVTTQIESHDYVAELFHALVRFNTILINLDRDMWTYVSLKYFRQKVYEGEVGSSTMPHKVNPIDFENSEANAGVSNGVLDHLAGKLMISRLQRDLSDSSALRNAGMGIGYSVLALRAARAGLRTVDVARAAIAADLADEWSVLAEAIQTVLRKYEAEDAYEQLKDLTQNRKVTGEDVSRFIDGLPIPEAERKALKAMAPEDYVGIAPAIARSVTGRLAGRYGRG
jgi:adenylosuccinate lyase